MHTDNRNADLVYRFIRLPLAQQKLFLEKLASKGVTLAQLPIPVARHDVERPVLSYAQQRQWFLWQLEPTGSAYNIPTALRFRGQLDLAALQRSFATLIQRHEALRTTIAEEDGQLMQVIHPNQPFQLARQALGAVEEQVLQAQVALEVQQPFDLVHGPLLRVKLLELTQDEHVLVLTLHHIVADGWSMPLLIDELVQLYEGYSQGREVALGELPIQYADYAIWQRAWMDAGERERQLAYWMAQLGDDHPVLELTTDRPRPALQSYRGERIDVDLGEALSQSLKQLAQHQGATPFMLLLASFQVLLHRYSGQADVRVGVPIANRNRVETERLIGFFVNTQVMRAEFDTQLTFTELLAQVRQRALGAQVHQDLPFEQLVDALQPERSLSHSPLFQVMYNHQTRGKGERRSLPGLEVESLQWNVHAAQFDLTLDSFEHELGISATLTFATDLFDASTIQQMARHWLNLLQGIVGNPGQRVAELPLLDDGERQQIVHGWNATQTDYPGEASIHQLVEAQVFATPDAPALAFGEQTLSYAELNRRSNQLAHKLRELGVGPDVLVGIAMERSLEMVIGLLGIVKAGGAYVPLDPDYPQDRLSYMFEDSGIALLLTQSHLHEALPIPAGLRSLDLDTENFDGYSDANPNVDVAPLNLAYVIYTSGSTGRPKGAGNSHQALVNRLCWMQKAYGLDASDSVLQKTPFSFDVSVWEFFWPLMTGARLVMAQPGAHRDPQLLVETINHYGISTLHFVPSMLQAFMTHEAVESCVSLKRVVCSGEALPAELARQTLQRLPAAGLYNLYGPTEAAIDVTHWTCQPDESISVPIGQPIDNLKTHILEGSLQPAVRGSAGELYLGGVGLARGYHQRPALTAERFVPDPFSDNGGRLYRTGDLARYRADGVIDYAGRIDHQVKIRGLRIELGEIEARLLELPSVQEAVVLALDGPSGKQLVGYVVPADSTQDEGALRDSLREALKAGLPDYMVPAHLLLLGKLPVTPNGKLDRKALPQPDVSQSQGEYVAPQSDLEQQIAAIWADVLKLEKVGLTDNFFELGGDSIISLQVVSRARQVDIQFTPKELLQHQTVQGLASVARRSEAQALEQGVVTGPLPLGPVQHWFFEQALVARDHWNQSVLLEPGKALDAQLLSMALGNLHAHHDLLRLNAWQSAGRWQATIGAPVSTELLWVRECVDAEALERLADQAQRSLNLAQGPLLRAVLATLADGSQRLLLVIHHLVVDGVSWRILLEDLQQAYQALALGQPLKLPAKTSGFKVWAEQLQAYASSQALQHELHYWRDQLQGASDALPCDHPQGENLQKHATSVSTRLDPLWTRKLLQQAPAAYRTQINDLLLTALARVVSRWTAQPQVLVRLEGHGREELFDGIDLSRTVGWFTSMYPVNLSPQPELASSIKTIKEQLRAVPHKGLGYGVLRYLGAGEARQTLAALAQGAIIFNYLGQFDGSFDQQASLFRPASENAGLNQDEDAPLSSLLALNGQVYGGELTLGWTFSREVFDTSTIQQLADAYAEELKALINHCCQDDTQGLTPSDFPLARLNQAQLDDLPVPAAQIADIYPLSPMQQGMLFHTLQESDAALYINQTAVDVHGLDIDRFVAAWNQVIASHDILRTVFLSSARWAEPLQVVQRQASLPLRVLDWRGREVTSDALQALAAEEAAEGFDLACAPLMRLTLVRVDEQRLHLIWSRHHILMDGWSNSRLLGEVLQVYHGRPASHAGGRFGDYIRWLAEQPMGKLEQFWSEKLRALEGPTLLADSVAPQADGKLVGHHALYLHWDAQRTQHLRDQARRLRVTANTLVQATWLLLLQRYTGQASVCFGATVAGRPSSLAGAGEMLGLFINTLPVVQAPQPQHIVSDWLHQLQHYNLELRDHEHAALADVQRWAGRPGQALFDSIVVFENYPVDDRLREGGGGTLRFGEVRNRDVTNYAMDLAVQLGETFSVEFLYLRNRFTEAAVECLRGSFESLLSAMLDNPQATLGSLGMLTPAQARHADLRNQLAAPGREQPLLAELIAGHARERGEAMAVVCGGQQLTYAQLDARANRLAHHLIAQGVRPESCVGIALERSVEVIVAFLAVMKTGAAYVPLDIDYPQERLQWIVEDSAMHLLVTSSGLRQRFTQVARCIELDQQALDHLPATAPEQRACADNLAYLIYTSGSTGKPKGVAVSHGQIRMHCQAIAGLYEMDLQTRELLFMSFAFDGAQERWLSTLSSGGCLVVRDNRLWTAEETWQTLHAQRIDIACFPPAYLQQLAEFADSQQQPAPAVRVYCFGGDAVPDALFEHVKRTLRPRWLTNGYGPTETVVTPLLWKVPVQRTCEAVYAPIGDRVGERTLHVLDPHLNPLPDGVAGELYIGGEGVARGYHQRAALTAERFVADPFAPGGRLYRTGDRVRRRADGVIDFLGRLDNQLKIRGFRIEPGEIEARLRNLAGVRDAVVVARDISTGKQLIGYVVTDNADTRAEQLRDALRADLPDHMVPAQLVLMPALPLTPNGKIDRNGLPAPEFAGRAWVAPRNAIEQALAAIWQEVLQVEQVGVDDNFFELGGDSLRVLKMLSKVRAREDLPIELKLRDVIARPTIAELSGYASDDASLDPLLLLNSRVSASTPLFCLHAGFGTVFDYEPLARRLEGRCTVYGLQCRMLLDHAWVDDSLETMAIDYAQYIRQKQPEGPYQLAGWSLGGTLAVLVAKELESQGQRVAVLALVDSFVPSARQAVQESDWSADLRGFLAVILGVSADALVLPVVPVGSTQDALERVIETARAAQVAQSAYAEIGNADLAQTFVVAMKLKALSRQLRQLPSTEAAASCWWAGEGAHVGGISGSCQDIAVDAGHYDILEQVDVLEGVIARLLLADTISQ
ncbi:non-ribosomal peptide synthetase [Pseudomonas plecoglossicida]|uniref:Non-ribosomal peptide synthetase n=5 Tax=Pseudomonas TaxID=286 RepID=A0A0B5K928_PSEDL|nr:MULTISPECIES: non-ribosomal peptide synthetase [Pseudomonas]MDY4309336.1 non-ribosomal peptide synthetase [Pseudomonas putida]AJG12081.1 peptide synthase [Pseudomonas plecoglossicida]MBF8786261.1 non-ribosomal peptide synthetase [Pseudomonas asiatica]MDY4318731.1 non-ribosomal peptide synthetase [Pseudomonas putida]MDY4352116.1 non-ribosomal peptide synthetase [Pseudomonas putida]